MLNTEEFLQQTTDQALDERLDPCPAGDWQAQAGKPEIKDFTYKSGEREGETGYRMVIRWTILDEEAKQAVDRDTLTVQQSLLLDLTPDGAGLDMGKGKNIGLGQIRAALGQNEPGQEWSPIMIEGQIAKVNVKQGVYQDRITAEVRSVAAAA